MKNRPEFLNGVTYEIKCPCGDMYITVNNDDDGNIKEVFAQIGKAGGCASAQNQVIGRLISIALRHGVELRYLVKQLVGIRCHLSPVLIQDKNKQEIYSCSDAIGHILSKYIKE